MKKNINKLTALLCIFATMLALSSCGGKKETSKSDAVKAPPPPVQVKEESPEQIEEKEIDKLVKSNVSAFRNQGMSILVAKKHVMSLFPDMTLSGESYLHKTLTGISSNDGKWKDIASAKVTSSSSKTRSSFSKPYRRRSGRR